MANSSPAARKSGPATPGISRAQGTVFIGIFLALILKTTLDTFFKGVADHNTLYGVIVAVRQHPAKNVVLAAQLIVFLFSLIRFYWGSFRYYQHKPRVEDTPELAVDLLGAILLFMAFYIVSLLVRTTLLFYYGIILVHGVDLVWFVIATTYLTLEEGIRKVASWYVLFDLVTIIAVGLMLLVNALIGPTQLYVLQWLALVAICLIGRWDIKKLWPYYKNELGWQDTLPRRSKTK